ncbi:MAG: ATP-binding domain-containing protein [Stigonema ocellatum SAG 48.90 = DSM 106950]|nr:ATP-binding domain-containing protein [Stigonema ocellatum SAG 48.90 = DSM 106950]
MFPDRLRSDVKSNAEKYLYQAFKEQLSDKFVVFHSVSWQVQNLNNGAKDGEVDFAIACPNLGILVLEVKGGKISYDGNADQWYSNNHAIKDPFKQACSSKHSLLSLLKEKPFWRKLWIPISYAVAFPDIKLKGELPLHTPREIILDSSHLTDLSAWVQGVMNYWQGQNPTNSHLGTNGIEQLIKIFRPSIVESVVVPFVNEERQFIKLVDKQFRILDFLARHRRVAISGCAGSGKTLLALEKTRRLNEQGFSVLLTCYNKALAQLLRYSLGNKQNLHIYTFHGICEKLLHQAGLASDNDQISKDKLFKEIYPNLLIEAANRLNWRVDAIVVDEGQDFCEDWWLALKLLLQDPDHGIFYLFYDDNQNIFGPRWKPPLEEAPFSLTENCRNTQKIHSYVLQFYPNDRPTIAPGPLGRDVEIHYYTGDNELKNTLGRILHHLVDNEKIATKDIVILTTKRKQALQNQILGRFRVKADPDISNHEIRCNTIHYFKGLESPVVILVEIDLNSVPHLKNLLYVGASRARHHLIIIRPDAPF